MGNQTFWEIQKNGARKEGSKSYSKGKETIISEHLHPPKKKLNTIEDPHNNHTFGIRGAHGLPPCKIVWVQCFNKVLIRHLHEGTNQKVQKNKYES